MEGARRFDVRIETIIYLLKECGFRTKACRHFRRFRVCFPPLEEWTAKESVMEVVVDDRQETSKEAAPYHSPDGMCPVEYTPSISACLGIHHGS